MSGAMNLLPFCWRDGGPWANRFLLQPGAHWGCLIKTPSWNYA